MSIRPVKRLIKSKPTRYQGIVSGDIPAIKDDDGTEVRIVSRAKKLQIRNRASHAPRRLRLNEQEFDFQSLAQE